MCACGAIRATLRAGRNEPTDERHREETSVQTRERRSCGSRIIVDGGVAREGFSFPIFRRA